MYIGNSSSKMYELYGNEVMRELHNKKNDMCGSKIMASLGLGELKTINTPLDDRIIKDSLSISKSSRDITKFYIKLNRSEIVKDIQHKGAEQRTIKLEYQVKNLYEKQEIDCQNDTKHDYDETKYEFYLELDDDIKEMVRAAIEYYDNNGSFAGIKNEDISKQTKAIEYDDLKVLVSLKKEINGIDKSQFSTEGEYYDTLLEKIDESHLSEKAKKSIGGYIKYLDLESKKMAELSPEEIEKEQASIKESIEREKKEAEKMKEMRRKEVLKLCEEFKRMYKKNDIYL